jgi:S-adenosyl methyltransferase
VAPRSYFMISQVVADDDEIGSATRAAAAQYSVRAHIFTPRTTQQILSLFEGLEIVKPGVRRLRHHGRVVSVLGGIGLRP